MIIEETIVPLKCPKITNHKNISKNFDQNKLFFSIKNANTNSVSVFDVMRQMHSRLLVDCKLGIFWLEKMNDAEKVFNNLLGISEEEQSPRMFLGKF